MINTIVDFENKAHICTYVAAPTHLPTQNHVDVSSRYIQPEIFWNLPPRPCPPGLCTARIPGQSWRLQRKEVPKAFLNRWKPLLLWG